MQNNNPHFDDNRIEWKDEYDGIYKPVDYENQFDDQWRFFLEKKIGFFNHSGVETNDDFINHRIYELVGEKNFLKKENFDYSDNNIIHSQTTSYKFNLETFRDKQCLDIGCGAGRWTKTLMLLGANVKSVDVSEHSLKSVSQFNKNFERLNVFDIENRIDLHNKFDFTMLWGVVQHTHNPLKAFLNAALTVNKGGYLYLMAYNKTYHESPYVTENRKKYRELKSLEEKLNFAYSISDNAFNAINQFDMLNTFYNWTFDEKTIYKWYNDNGFENIQRINNGGCAHHFIGKKF